MIEQVTLSLCSIDPDWLSFWGRLFGPTVGGLFTLLAAWGIFSLTRKKDRRNSFVDLCVELQLKIGSLVSVNIDILNNASLAQGLPGANVKFPEKEFLKGIHDVRTSCKVCLMHVDNHQIANTLKDIDKAAAEALRSYRLQYTEDDFHEYICDPDSYWDHVEGIASGLNESLERLSELLVRQIRFNPPALNPTVIKSYK